MAWILPEVTFPTNRWSPQPPLLNSEVMWEHSPQDTKMTCSDAKIIFQSPIVWRLVLLNSANLFPIIVMKHPLWRETTWGSGLHPFILGARAMLGLQNYVWISPGRRSHTKRKPSESFHVEVPYWRYVPINVIKRERFNGTIWKNHLYNSLNRGIGIANDPAEIT